MDPARLRRLYVEHVAELERGYARALAEHGYDSVVIHSGAPKTRTRFDDQYWPLRPTPEFQHWTPLVAADCALLIRIGQRPKLVWPTAVGFWEAPAKADSDHWQASFDLVEVEEVGDVRAHLHPAGRAAFLGEDEARASAWGFNDANPPALARALDRLRVVKTEYEVACLDEANRRAAAGHERVAAAFRDGDRSELDLHLLYLQATEQDDPETPYKNIVALGAHASTLHHVSYARRAEPRASLLLDAGATVHGYCSDITRTHVKGAGAAESAFAGIVAGVEKMQQRLVAAATVGRKYESLHEESHAEVGRILVDAGVARMSAEEAVTSGVTRAFYPHGLGHSLGLQCHDVGCAELKPKSDNPFLRNTTTIAPGQVFTVEPGIYFIDLLLAPLRHGPHAARVDWKLVDALAPLGGVRIEDDVRILDGKPPQNLTRQYLP
ncbi:MAG TPA: Xaa-Pro dipeptidase [Polyangia bacterium]|nr:Xaa-Pro dipeptidase [Polyangia bacterium]